MDFISFYFYIIVPTLSSGQNIWMTNNTQGVEEEETLTIWWAGEPARREDGQEECQEECQEPAQVEGFVLLYSHLYSQYYQFLTHLVVHDTLTTSCLYSVVCVFNIDRNEIYVQNPITWLSWLSLHSDSIHWIKREWEPLSSLYIERACPSLGCWGPSGCQKIK